MLIKNLNELKPRISVSILLAVKLYKYIANKNKDTFIIFCVCLVIMNYYKQMDDYIIKRFENPDEVREFDKGKYEVVNLPHMTIGKATYHKGWKWSDDVSPLSGTEFCETEHLGMVISGNATVAFENEEPKVIGPGDIFYVSNTPHDSWVVGEEDYVSIHFMGAEKYAD